MKKIIFSLLLFYCTAAEAQHKKPFFNTLNVATGLPEAYVQASLQDKYGYMWLGTQNGLLRYDGYKIKPYAIYDAGGHEIIAPGIEYLYEDGHGKLWAFIQHEGFYYYDRTRDVFVTQKWNDAATDTLIKKTTDIFYWLESNQPQVYFILALLPGKIPFEILLFDAIHNSLESFSAGGKGKSYIPAYRTIDIRKDADGKVWMIADSLLSYFDAKTTSFIPWFVLPDNPKSDFFESFLPDPADAGILWMNTYNPAVANNPKQPPHAMRILQFNTKTKQYKNFLPDSSLPGALPANGLRVYTDSLKRVWVSTQKGISLFNRQHSTFTNYPLSFTFAGESSVLAADKEGNLWMGGDFAVLCYLNTKSGIVTKYSGGEDPGDLPAKFGINKLFVDRSGTLWVSTPFGGIHYLNRQKSLFAPIRVTPNILPAASNTGPYPYAIAGHQGDSICFLRDTAGLYAWHTVTNNFDKIDLKNRAAYGVIISTESRTDGRLWIATYGQGLFEYDPLTKSVINYKQNPNSTLSVSSDFITGLIVDKEGVLWIGTERGLCSLNKQTGKFTQYPFINNDGVTKANNTLDDGRVKSMLIDSDGILWIGTNLGGLNRFDKKTGEFTSYLNSKDGFTCVISLLEDSHKRFWAGTYTAGLFLFDRKAGTYKRYSEREGLINNTTGAIGEDAAGNIWTNNGRGMSRLNPANSTIINFSFAEFNIDNGINGGYIDSKRNIHMSTKNGIVVFNPMQLNDNRIPPSVIIESVNYHAANTGTPGDTVLFTEGRQGITLAYNENKISFQFVALHFANAPKNEYAYLLEGIDKNWIQAGTQHTASYTNLSAGTYTFKVKAANSDGVWNETGAGFTITILPPWWKTWWAYCLYVLLIGGGIWSYIQYRSKALRSENAALEEKVNQRTNQLQQSLTNLKATQTQLIQSEKMASLGELTAGIAHEIQNPLNFINNFSEVNKELIDEMQAELNSGNTEEAVAISNDIKANEEKINYHGKRADAIVKGMLQHSRSSTGKKELTDINALADEYLRLSYHGLRAKDKSFNADFKTDFDKTIGRIEVMPQDFGRVLLNLYNNAFYAVNEKKKQAGETYKPLVLVSTKKLDGKIEISVMDNGTGIPQKGIDKIFQPFFTTKPTGQGTGLGLSLSYDIIKAHGGELKVETKEGEGTEFTIQLIATKN